MWHCLCSCKHIYEVAHQPQKRSFENKIINSFRDPLLQYDDPMMITVVLLQYDDPIERLNQMILFIVIYH